jgi:cell division protein FtsB
MRPRVLLVVAGGVALAVATWTVLSPTGLPRLLEMKDDERSLAADVEAARAENARLTEEVRILQGDEPESAAVLEKVAREELGWIKSDEVVLTGLPTGEGAAASGAEP